MNDKRGRPTIGSRRGVPLYTTLEPKYREALERLAAQDDRSLSNYVRKILVRHVQENETDDAKGSDL